jgi:hypothetical protein
MIEYLTSAPALVLIASFWLVLEYQQIGIYLSMNPFESVAAVQSLPKWLKSLTLLFSNSFVVLPAILVILGMSFVSTPWYFPMMNVLIGWIVGYALLSVRLAPAILGYYVIAVAGPLWILGFAYYCYIQIVG